MLKALQRPMRPEASSFWLVAALRSPTKKVTNFWSVKWKLPLNTEGMAGSHHVVGWWLVVPPIPFGFSLQLNKKGYPQKTHEDVTEYCSGLWELPLRPICWNLFGASPTKGSQILYVLLRHKGFKCSLGSF